MKLKNVIDKIEKSKNLIELIIMFITAICTVIGVYLGFAQINSTLKEQRFSNRLELADDLMSEYMTLSSHGSKAVFYVHETYGTEYYGGCSRNGNHFV